MAKRSIEDYRPRGVDLEVLEARYVSEKLLDGLVTIAGSLPDRTFSIPVLLSNPGKVIQKEVSARDYLRGRLANAANAYRYQIADSKKPTSVQLAARYADIESAAKKLLQQLRVSGQAGPSANNMPAALRYGAMHTAAEEDAAQRREKHAMDCNGDSLLREAIEGVANICTWAKAAKASEKNKSGEGVNPKTRNEGKGALNEFLKVVAIDCWQMACGQEMQVGSKFLEFAELAAESIGEKQLPDRDALERQFRRLLGGSALQG